MFTRIAVGRERVVREVRAAAPLMTALRAPVTARGPWLTAVLGGGAAHWPRARPAAVVVEAHAQGRPEGVAFLALRRRGPTTVLTLLGADCTPAPGGWPPARLLARDEPTAGRLAAGICDLLGSLREPRTLRLTGLPLGDPTTAALAARLPTSVLANARSTRLVDELDSAGAVLRSRDPAALERWLPALLARAEGPRTREFLRSAARLHAATGELEVAVVPDGGVPDDDQPRAALLTLLDGSVRRPWWGFGDGGLRTEMGEPLVSLTVPARAWPRLTAGFSRRSAAR